MWRKSKKKMSLTYAFMRVLMENFSHEFLISIFHLSRDDNFYTFFLLLSLDVIHSDCGGLGKSEPIGDAGQVACDVFWINYFYLLLLLHATFLLLFREQISIQMEWFHWCLDVSQSSVHTQGATWFLSTFQLSNTLSLQSLGVFCWDGLWRQWE